MATTTTATKTEQDIVMPPEPPGPVMWLRKNLFSNWYNSLLTIISLTVLYLAVSGVLRWAISQADWRPVVNHPLLYLVGQYPRDQLWRIGVGLVLASFLAGASMRYWGRVMQVVVLTYAAFLAVLTAWPPAGQALTNEIRIFLLVNIAIIGAGYLAGRQLRFRSSLLLAAWLFTLALTLVLLRGFSGSRAAPTLSTQIWTGLLLILVLSSGIGHLFARNARIKRGLLLGAFLFSLSLIVVVLRGFPLARAVSPVSTQLWGGLLVTMLLSVGGIVLSFPIGVLLALGRRSGLPVVRWLCTIFIEVVRGVPLIGILFMASLILPLFLPTDIRIDRLLRALIGMILFSAAYMAENVRGGLAAVPQGQVEAANALGLNNLKVTILIILPQALRAVIPPIVGQFISLFKDTTLAAGVAVLELLSVGLAVLQGTPEYFGLQMEVLLFIAAIFWILSYLMSYASLRLEAALGVGER
jgi:general L-amino acid transport system permease protein